MKLGQVLWNGNLSAAIFDKGGVAGDVRPIPDYTLRDLIDRCIKEKKNLVDFAKTHAVKTSDELTPAIPIQPREVWACGCTYEMSASFRDAEHGTREGFYKHVFTAPRPEIFFKGTSRVCVGSGAKIGIRRDSEFTAPEPELAALLGANGEVLGYTLANDPRYQGSWAKVEPEARSHWEERNPGTWEQFKDAVHHAWMKIRGKA